MDSLLSAPQFHDEAAAIAYVEARLWPHGPECPQCGVLNQAAKIPPQRSKASKKHPEGKPVIGVWRCLACKKQFTVRIGSIFESSHVPLRIWLQAMYLIASSKKGIATRQLHRTFGGSLKTAWFLGHRVRECMKKLGFEPPIGGEGRTVEADETFVGRKPGTKIRRGHGHRNPVMALVERGGEVRSFHIPNVTADNMRPIIARHVHADSRFMTDELRAYTHMGWPKERHHTVKHQEKEYVRGDAYTNTIEGFFSILKRGIYGCYFHVSEHHLHRYLSKYRFRYSHREKLGVDDVQRADLILKGAVGKRLTYETVGRAAAPSEKIPF